MRMEKVSKIVTLENFKLMLQQLVRQTRLGLFHQFLMPVNVSESEILFLSSIFLFQIRIVYLHQIPLIIPTLRNNIILLLLRLIMNQSCMFVMLGLTITGTKVITLLVGGYASNVKKEITNFPPPLKRTFCNYQFSARSAVFLWAEGLLMGSKLFITYKVPKGRMVL